MKLAFTYLSILLFVFSKVIAQNFAQKWYFGNKAALDFSVSPPVTITNSAMYAPEGCSSISDASGNLLFYTNGNTVWNKNNQVMGIWNGLQGSTNANQSSVIAKQPGNNNIYFIITQGTSLKYSIVDMNLAAGSGSLTIKNAMLFSAGSEMVTAALHCNGKDIWIVSRDHNSANFRTHLLTAAGINTTGILSPIGSVHKFPFGNIKVSSNGKKIGKVHYNDTMDQTIELFDFDDMTGVVSNSLTLLTILAAPGNTIVHSGLYNCEFSQDGSKFYAGLRDTIFQWDLCAGSDSTILASKFPLHTKWVEGMQLAPDGKIYICWINKKLSVIHSPNLGGLACNIQDTAVSLAPNSAVFGLPNFVSGYLKPSPSPYTFSLDPTTCATFSFFVPNTPTININCSAVAGQTISSLLWSFGDPLSGFMNNSTNANPLHHFSGPGIYAVKLILNYNCGSDTLTQLITVGPTISLTAFPSLTVCAGESVTLTASGAAFYSWNNNTTGSVNVISPSISHTILLSGTDSTGNCINTKSISIAALACLDIDVQSGIKKIFKVSPNPSFGEFTIESSYSGRIFIFDFAGVLVDEMSVIKGNQQLDLRRQPHGLFILKIMNDDGVAVLKIIKLE